MTRCARPAPCPHDCPMSFQSARPRFQHQYAMRSESQMFLSRIRASPLSIAEGARYVKWCSARGSNPDALSRTASSTRPVYRFQQPSKVIAQRTL